MKILGYISFAFLGLASMHASDSGMTSVEPFASANVENAEDFSMDEAAETDMALAQAGTDVNSAENQSGMYVGLGFGFGSGSGSEIKSSTEDVDTHDLGKPEKLEDFGDSPRQNDTKDYTKVTVTNSLKGHKKKFSKTGGFATHVEFGYTKPLHGLDSKVFASGFFRLQVQTGKSQKRKVTTSTETTLQPMTATLKNTDSFAIETSKKTDSKPKTTTSEENFEVKIKTQSRVEGIVGGRIAYKVNRLMPSFALGLSLMRFGATLTSETLNYKVDVKGTSLGVWLSPAVHYCVTKNLKAGLEFAFRLGGSKSKNLFGEKSDKDNIFKVSSNYFSVQASMQYMFPRG